MLAVDVLDTRNDLLVRVSVGFQPLDQPQGLALGHAVVHRPPSFLTGASRALRDHYTLLNVYSQAAKQPKVMVNPCAKCTLAKVYAL